MGTKRCMSVFKQQRTNQNNIALTVSFFNIKKVKRKKVMCPPTNQIHFKIFEKHKSSIKENAKGLQWAQRF